MAAKFLPWASGWMVIPLTKTRIIEGGICVSREALGSVHQSDALVCKYQKSLSQMVETIRIHTVLYYKKFRGRAVSELVNSEAQHIHQRLRIFQLCSVIIRLSLRTPHSSRIVQQPQALHYTCFVSSQGYCHKVVA